MCVGLRLECAKTEDVVLSAEVRRHDPEDKLPRAFAFRPAG